MKHITVPQQPGVENSANSVYEAKESNCEPFCRAQLNQAGPGFHKDTNTNENENTNTKCKGIQIQEQWDPIVNYFVAL